MKTLTILIIILLFTQCEPVTPQQSSVNKQILFDDHDYEDIVGVVKLVPLHNGTPEYLENPIVQLQQPQQPLLLEFDLLSNRYEYLTAKIYHCNKDWNKSLLRDMEYLDVINTIRVNTYDFSLNTVQHYVNYRVALPIPKLSGNYMVAIHRGNNGDDLLLTRRFLVVDNVSEINQLLRISTTVAKRDYNQQIEFDVYYGNVPVSAPNKDISVVLLQNHRWLDAITNLQPTLIKPTQNYLEYRSLGLENNFPGWNEFRFFDMRTLGALGRNVRKINTSTDRIDVFLAIDQSKENKVYTQNFGDLNGNYFVQDVDPGENYLHSDYANVHFTLLAEPLRGDVYVLGRFNNWQLNENNRMRFDSTNGVYKTSLLLKQGYYDFSYWANTPGKSPFLYEGSHYQTENEYEILVYYRKPGNVYDELIGYKRFNSVNPG